METESQQPGGREGTAEALNAAIEATNLAERVSSIASAKAVFGSVNLLLTQIKDSTVNELDHTRLGLLCADICQVLHQGTDGKRRGELSQAVLGAIDQLSATIADIRSKLAKWSRRNTVCRRSHAKKDKKTVAAWRLSLENILQVFNALPTNTDAAAPAVHQRSALKRSEDPRGQNRPPHASAPGESSVPMPGSTHGTDFDIRRDIRAIASHLERNMKGREVDYSRNALTRTSIPGESPPLPPRTFFGRDKLIEEIVDLVEKFTPIALIGAGGIGKTSIAQAVLHHDRIKQRFGHHRRFIRCDGFPASSALLLQRLSDVTGAGVRNPENLTPLRTFLSSKEMVIVLDNAESILDPQETDAQEIYAVVEELSQFSNICVCITSRISLTPSGSKRLNVPTLLMDAARDTFYGIYDSDADRSGVVNRILKELDFHPLSIVLLATAAHQNQWDMSRLAQEWEQRRTSVLQTQHNRSLAATIELSLTSPLFQKLGPDARALLGVVAFFPQGIDENNLEWLFPTTSNRTDIFDRFCILSLTHRTNGFITMIAPLRNYLSPEDPKTSPLLCTTKERYFARISIKVDPKMPNFEETRWITSEDVNVEHLLDVFTTIDKNSNTIWDTCACFMEHLYWHKKRTTTLASKIKDLPDDHHSKPECLFQLSQLFESVGNHVERKKLLVHALTIWRERGSDYMVGRTLMELSNVNWATGFHEEGMKQANEASEILKKLGDTASQAQSLVRLAYSLLSDRKFDAAEKAALCAIDLLPEKGKEFLVSESHRALGNIYRSKGDTKEAIHHFEVAIGIATPFKWHDTLFCIHYELAALLRGEGRFYNANAHIEHAKSHTAGNTYYLGCTMELQARVWYEQNRLEEARSEALRVANIFNQLGAVKDAERCEGLLRMIENSSVASGKPGLYLWAPVILLSPARADSSL